MRLTGCVHSESVHGASLLFNERTLFLAGIDQEGFFLPLYALLVSRHTLAPATWEAAKGPSGDDKISRLVRRCYWRLRDVLQLILRLFSMQDISSLSA